MLHILMGRARSGKSDRVLRRIAQQGDQGHQILLVPEHASHQAEVDLCRVCGDTASRHAEVLSFRRLCDRVLSRTGGIAEVTLDAGGKLLNLQKVLMELSPELHVYRRPSQKAVFLQEMLDLFDELRCYAVTPEQLYQQAEQMQGGTKEKLTDLSLLFGAYEARLHTADFDARDQMSKLCDHLEESGYITGKDVTLDGFTYFNAQERKVLAICLRQASEVTVTLLGDPESREEIFAPSLKTREQLIRLAGQEGCPWECTVLSAQDDSALGHLERYGFGETVPYEGDASCIRLRQAATAFSEVEQTAAEIRRLAASGACRYRDITVAARNMSDYAGVIESVFARYEIPVYLSQRSEMLEKPVWSLLTGVLSAVENGMEYEEMFQWLKTGLTGIGDEACDRLENYVLKWEIHGRMWLRDTDWTDHPGGYGARWTPQQESELEQVNQARRRVRELLLPLAEGLKNGQTALEKIHALYGFLESIGLQESLEAQMRAQAEAGRMQEAEETAQLWKILCGILDQFAQILGTESMETETFARLLRQVASQYSVGSIPAALDQVNVSEITRNDRHTTKYLFLLGANDHVLPGVGSSGGILNESDREELALRGITLAPAGMEQMGIELQNLYAALAQPTRALTVSYPTADSSGTTLRPAFIVDRMKVLFPELRTERESAEKEYRFTAIAPAMEMAGQEVGGALWQYFAREEGFHARLEAMARAAQWRRGALSAPAVQALYGKHSRMSASRLERLRSCHFAYFMEYGLRAKPREAASFDAPQIGTFLHYLLENVTRDVLAAGGFSAIGADELHAMTQRYIDRYAAEELHDFQNRNARFRYLFARLRNTAFAVVDQIAEEQRHSDFIPLEFELSFGDQGTLPAVCVSEPDGDLRISGKVDRVDGWVRDGKLYLRVVDYKSGRKAFDLSSVRMGLDLQMLLYLFTLQKEGAAHFGHQIEPAGVLYLPARDEILSAQRNIGPEQLQRMREKELRRTGLLLRQPEVLQAMEHEALSEPRFLPLRVSRDGDLGGSLASAAQLGQLGRYVETLLHQIFREVRQGNIDADPCCRSEEDSFCQYCDWSGACHFQDGRDRDRLHYIYPITPEEFWREMEQQEGGDQTWKS